MAADEERTVGEKIELRLAAIEEHLGIGNAAEPQTPDEAQETVSDTETTESGEPAAPTPETT